MMDIKLLVSSNFVKAHVDGEEGEMSEAIHCTVQRQRKRCSKPGRGVNPPPLPGGQKSTQYALLLMDLVKV